MKKTTRRDQNTETGQGTRDKLFVIVLAAVSMIADIAWAGNAVAAGAPDSSPTRGKLIGAQVVTHPEWFIQSFLDIPEDAAAAGGEGRHAILFFDSPGCPYCYKMIEENFKHSWYTDFIRENFHTIALNIHGDREVAFNEDLHPTEKELARLLNIRFTPTMLFLDSASKTVLRIDGYRSVDNFKQILDYVHEKAYLSAGLSEYLEAKSLPAVYTLRPHPDFQPLSDLSRVKTEPLMVIFEDKTCTACDALHDNLLPLDSTRELMKDMTVVRLDAQSDQIIIDVTGRETTPKQWARELELTYRPGIVMFDAGKEVFRIDAFRYTFHFQQALRYVVERQWQNYERYSDFASAHREAVLDSGVDVNVQE